MTRPKLLILGYARHGKDTVAEILRDQHEYQFISSSMFCADKVVRPAMAQQGISYPSVEACFEDRVNHRAWWHRIIADFNRDDATRLSRGILEVADIYVGMRSDREYQLAKHLYDDVWWVDALGRGLPPEDKSSMDIEYDPATMRLIDNNGSLEDLYAAVAFAEASI